MNHAVFPDLVKDFQPNVSQKSTQIIQCQKNVI